jgi:parallel beta-helix repeat protein
LPCERNPQKTRHHGCENKNRRKRKKKVVKTLNKKIALFSIVLILLFSTVVRTPFIPLVRAITWAVDDDGPADFHTIQEAINAASFGDTIIVMNGTYYENVVVNKTVSLVGENRNSTIIDGNKTGVVLSMRANNVTVEGFTVRNAGILSDGVGVFSNGSKVTNSIIVNNSYGVAIYGDECCSNNRIVSNIVTDNMVGIRLSSHHNRITGNNITNNDFGIWLENSSGNTLRNNVLDDNEESFGVTSSTGQLSDFIQDIDVSNTVNGKPICYWVNRHDEEVSSDAGFIGLVNCTNITIKNQELKNNLQGVILAYTNNSRIQDLNVTNNMVGIHLYRSFKNTISDNNIKNDSIGISLESFSENNKILGNNVMDNFYGIWLNQAFGNQIANNNINNTIDYGIFMQYSDGNDITGNTITNSSGWGEEPRIHGGYAIDLASSRNNRIIGNAITSNRAGIVFYNGVQNNTFYHNNFIDNKVQASVDERYTNSWDNGIEGNYWSNYSGADLNHDGIGDSWCQIDENNTDHYPLMGMFQVFNVTWQEETHHVNVISNSTVSNFEFEEVIHLEAGKSWKEIHFQVTGPDDAIGFCRICIPRALMNDTYEVFVSGREVPNTVLPCSNSTHSYLYFTYSHSTLEVIIIPEFPSALILPSLMMFTLVAVILTRKTQFRKQRKIT